MGFATILCLIGIGTPCIVLPIRARYWRHKHPYNDDTVFFDKTEALKYKSEVMMAKAAEDERQMAQKSK